MEYTLATLEDTLGALDPKDQEISNYLQTLPKERIVNVFKSLPPFIQTEICNVNNQSNNSNILKDNMTEIGATTLIGGGLGYYVGGWGGAVVAGLLGATAMYYYKKNM